MTESSFATSKKAKEAGWFSRRHQTDEANRDARLRYQTQHGKKARQRRAMLREHAA